MSVCLSASVPTPPHILHLRVSVNNQVIYQGNIYSKRGHRPGRLHIIHGKVDEHAMFLGFLRFGLNQQILRADISNNFVRKQKKKKKKRKQKSSRRLTDDERPGSALAFAQHKNHE